MKSVLNSIFVPRYYLLAIGAGLLLIHLTLVYKISGTSFFGISLLCWGGVASLIWDRRDQYKFNSSFVPTFCSLLLVTTLLLKSATAHSSEFLGVYPFLSGIGMALLASGFFGFKQYWRELVILFFLGVPKTILWPVLDISILTAKMTTAMMWYVGLDVKQFGTKIAVFDVVIDVKNGCSGFDAVFFLLSLAVLFLNLFSINGWKKFLVPFVAMAIAFLVNCVRIVVMAVLLAKQKETFNYFHGGDGSLIFPLISVGIFGVFCYFLLENNNSPPSKKKPNF